MEPRDILNHVVNQPEVLQNVAVAAIEHGDRLRDATKIAPWLYRLAVVGALQWRRRQGRGKKLLDRYATRVPPTESDIDEPDPLDWLLAGEQRKLMRTALRRLPRRDAEILILKYTEDWSYRQLAQHLGLSTSAVEARLHRARQRLRGHAPTGAARQQGPAARRGERAPS